VTQRGSEFYSDIDDLRACRQKIASFEKEQSQALGACLHDAVRKGSASEVQELLARGADCNVVVLGNTPLHVAIQSQQFGLIPLLLSAGADPVFFSKGSNESPILLACSADFGNTMFKRHDVLMSLLSALQPQDVPSAVSAASAAGATPLLCVARRLADAEDALFSASLFEDELCVARSLIARGADVHAADIFGFSPATVIANMRRSYGLIA
jgi:hypothetical protein